ncbi:hypothetical protein ACFFRR_000176 [Megaselia abdita]
MDKTQHSMDSTSELLEKIDENLESSLLASDEDDTADLNQTVIRTDQKLSKKEKKRQRKLNKSLEGQQQGNVSLTIKDKSDKTNDLFDNNNNKQNKPTETTADVTEGRSSDGGELGGLVELMSTVNANENNEKGNVLQTSAMTNRPTLSFLVDQKNDLKNSPSCLYSQKPSKKKAVGNVPAPTPKRSKQEPVDNSNVDESLKVAIIDENNMEGILEAKVWEKAKASIYDGIRKHIRAHPDAEDVPLYEFLGNQKGVRIVSCADELSLNFLKNLVESLNFSEDGVSLKVILRSNIPVYRRFKVSVPITSENETFDDLKAMIKGLNKKIGSAKWKFYIPKDKMETNVGGTRYLMFIGMPEEQVQKVKDLNFLIHYGLEKLQLCDLEENSKNGGQETNQPDRMDIDGNDDAAKQS